MNDFVLSCCSTADLTKEHFDERKINYVCLHFEIDGVDYLDDLGKSISFDEFYKLMEKGAVTKTSQLNIQQFVTYFEEFLKEGKDILHLCLSSGLSGIFNSATAAADILKEKYPERKIFVVDSLASSSGYGLIMDTLADMRDDGKTIEEIYNWVEEHKLELHHWFFSTTLKYYVRGGRVSKVAGFVGELLKFCPLMNVSNEGKLIPREKVRTKKKVIEAVAKKMEENAFDGLNYSGKCYVCHSASLSDAEELARLVEERFPNIKGKVEINNIGTAIGSHSGPGTVAVFFWGNKRTN